MKFRREDDAFYFQLISRHEDGAFYFQLISRREEWRFLNKMKIPPGTEGFFDLNQKTSAKYFRNQFLYFLAGQICASHFHLLLSVRCFHQHFLSGYSSKRLRQW